MSTFATVGLGLGTAAACGLAYSAGYEVRAFTLREVTAAGVLPSGHGPVRVLHVSDLHLMPNQGKKLRWLEGLADSGPDLIVATGDFISSPNSIAPLRSALDAFAGVPGVFVFGSNDYYGPKLKNPARYLMKDRGVRIHDDPLPTAELRSQLLDLGWSDLTHVRTQMTIGGANFEFRGVDDPHLELDDYTSVAGPVAPGSVGIGVTHAPYLRVLDAMFGDGCRMVFAGHTHGGQLRVPGIGALVTNCDLPRRQARGLSAYGGGLLHVSAGAGTNPYTPVRFACRPEASLVTLTD